jgi:hypothetical protein
MSSMFSHAERKTKHMNGPRSFYDNPSDRRLRTNIIDTSGVGTDTSSLVPNLNNASGSGQPTRTMVDAPVSVAKQRMKGK